MLHNRPVADTAVSITEHEHLHGCGVPAACAGKVTRGAHHSFGMAALEVPDGKHLTLWGIPLVPLEHTVWPACAFPGPGTFAQETCYSWVSW